MNLDEKKRGKHLFEKKIKILYDMKRPNGVNYIHDNKVN